MSSNDESRFLLNPDTAELMERVLYEVKRVVVGQDRFLERVMVALLAGGITFLLLRDDAPARRGATTVQLQP